MTWNYRLMAHKSSQETTIQIHEVYYNDKGEPYLFSSDEVGAHGETVEEVEADLELMKEALLLPILMYDDFPREYIEPRCKHIMTRNPKEHQENKCRRCGLKYKTV